MATAKRLVVMQDGRRLLAVLGRTIDWPVPLGETVSHALSLRRSAAVWENESPTLGNRIVSVIGSEVPISYFKAPPLLQEEACYVEVIAYSHRHRRVWRKQRRDRRRQGADAAGFDDRRQSDGAQARARQDHVERI